MTAFLSLGSTVTECLAVYLTYVGDSVSAREKYAFIAKVERHTGVSVEYRGRGRPKMP